MDAFFASIEARDDPSLRGKPLLVGGGGRRGVVAAASYEARAFGCHSAQPTAVALRKCPHAIVVPPRMERYVEASRQVFEIFERYTPVVEGLSIDEAFLDLSGTERLHGSASDVAEAIRRDVRATTGVTCSVGIAAVKFVAKIASAMNKPNGLKQVPAGEERAFLDPLPVGKLWGVGPKAREALAAWGVKTVGDLARCGRPDLERKFGKHGEHLWRLSHGLDAREVVVGRDAKSLSSEDTYAEDLVGREAIEQRLLAQATRVADRLTRKGMAGRRVQLKIRDTTFHTQTRQLTLARPTAEARTIYRAALSLLDKVDIQGRRFRLTGVGVADFSDAPVASSQLELLVSDEGRAEAEADARHDSDRRLQQTLTAVRDRFGNAALYPAATTRDGVARGGRELGKNRDIDPED